MLLAVPFELYEIVVDPADPLHPQSYERTQLPCVKSTAGLLK